MACFEFPEGSLTLNAEQAAIVRQPPTQSMRILASAGSGKTTTLTARIAHLLTTHGARPDQIVLLTFTHNAAEVMRERLQALVGARRILCGTFHALSQQILREQAPASLADVYHVDELPLKALDWLATSAGRAWVASLRWIFIDEFQDINDTQFAFIRALHHPAAALTIVGDDAQNIYSWRGSDVDYILNFHRRFADVADFQLATNYRSTGAIVAVANSIMRHIPTLPHKQLMSAAPAAPAGARPEVHYFARTAEERDWVCEAAIAAAATGSTVILSKFNSVLYSYEAALLRAGVRARFVDGGGVGASHAGAPPTVFLSTFHGSKGLEWDSVFLVRMNDEVFPQQKDEDSVLQERRLFYVAVTRARRTLTITYSRHERSLSRFVREIHRPLLVWRRLPQYELSNLSAAITPTAVADWVASLAGEDYRTIKQLGLLPAGLLHPGGEGTATATAAPWFIPYWWTEQGLASEFVAFLRALWLREVAAVRPESGGQWDREAQRLIWTIKIAPEDSALFETYRPLFEALVDRFFGATVPGEAPPQIYYTELLAAIRAEAPGTPFEHADIIRIIQIIHKMRTMLYNLRFAAVALSDLQFAPIRHSPPQESRCELIRAWRRYTDPVGCPLSATPTVDELLPIYLVGLCRSLAAGRAGVIVNLPGEREWARCRDFLREFRGQARAAVAAADQPVLCRLQAELVPGVVAEADMLVGETAWFFVGGDAPSELQRLDRALQILLTVHALRGAGHSVNRVCLFQLVTGAAAEWSVADWGAAPAGLLAAFVQARVQHVAAADE
ncbi:ATP-dependent helicase [bacterium]|nr:ATP-dependent helicase [bacterium]